MLKHVVCEQLLQQRLQEMLELLHMTEQHRVLDDEEWDEVVSTALLEITEKQLEVMFSSVSLLCSFFCLVYILLFSLSFFFSLFFFLSLFLFLFISFSLSLSPLLHPSLSLSISSFFLT